MGEVKREGVRRFEMSVHPEPEVPYSVRPIPDEHGAFTYWGTWMDDHAKEIATLRTQLEDHRLAHDDAKAAWEKECSERDIAEDVIEAAERERDDARKALAFVIKWVPHTLQSGWTPWVQEQIDAARDLE